MAIKLYWCRGKGRDDPSQQNFGDYLSPLLVEMLSGKPVIYAPVHKADMMAVGSIMNREKKAQRYLLPRKLHVWGAGSDAPGLKFSGRHYYHAVRGARTREQINGLRGSPALGDPGLLAAHWWGARPRPDKRFKIGLIAHYVDQKLEAVLRAGTTSGVKLIDVYWPVEEVLRSIQECHFIISSSMHGLIVADAFGVPNRRIVFSRGQISDYKFTDYYSAFGLAEPIPLGIESLSDLSKIDPAILIGEYARPGLEIIQTGLISAFPTI